MGATGYFVSPYHPYVQETMDDLYPDHFTTYNFDMVYEETFAHNTINLDMNASAPYPESYYDGWLEKLESHIESGIITQTGYDRQAEFARGFIGTLYTPEGQGSILDDIGVGNWEYWPVSSQIYHEKVMIYQNQEHTTSTKDALAWNLSFGCMLNLMPNSSEEQSIEGPWMRVVRDFQYSVLSKLVPEKLSGYEVLDTQLTKSLFENYSVVRNWNKAESLDYGNHTISSEGAILTGTGVHVH